MVQSKFGSAQQRNAPLRTCNISAARRGRGRTINIKGKRRTSQSKGEVVFSFRLGRAVGGDDMTEFVTELGVVVRGSAPLNVEKWAHVDGNIKLKMWDSIVEKYNGISNHKLEVMALLKTMYRNWRWRLHQDYLKFNTDEQRLQNPPAGIKEEEWKFLVEYFGSDDFKKMSERNKLNRSKQGVSSICGRKSFASILHSMIDPVTKKDPKLTDFWKATHQRQSNGSWCSQKSEAVLPRLQEISESQQDQENPMSTEEQLTEAFGLRSGYLRGLGSGPKPLSRKNLEIRASQVACEQQVQDLRDELQCTRDEAEEREARIRKESEEREARIHKESEEREARLKDEQMKTTEAIRKEFNDKFSKFALLMAGRAP